MVHLRVCKAVSGAQLLMRTTAATCCLHVQGSTHLFQVLNCGRQLVCCLHVCTPIVQVALQVCMTLVLFGLPGCWLGLAAK
jgi:hypothetical protein